MLIRGSRTLLRAASDADAAVIVALFDSEHTRAAHGPGFPKSPSSVKTRLRDDGRKALAIEIDGRVRGYLELMLSWADTVLSIQEFIMDAELVGRGYGRDALHALLAFFFQNWGGRRAELTVRADNERALRCYQSVGFVIEGRRRAVIPPDWGPPASRDYLWMGMLPAELTGTARPRS